jgi:hypothetical protein
LARKKFHIDVDLVEIGRMYASLFVTAITLYLVLTPFDGIVKIAIGGCVGYTVFGMMTILFKVITKRDLNMLQRVLAPQPLIGKMSTRLLPHIKRLARM